MSLSTLKFSDILSFYIIIIDKIYQNDLNKIFIDFILLKNLVNFKKN